MKYPWILFPLLLAAVPIACFAENVGPTLRSTGAPTDGWIVVVTDGPCFQPGTHYHGAARPSRDGTFSASVYPPAGTRLEVCAAHVDAGVRTSTLWGRASRGPWIAEGRSGMRVFDVEVTAGVASPITVPSGIALDP